MHAKGETRQLFPTSPNTRGTVNQPIFNLHRSLIIKDRTRKEALFEVERGHIQKQHIGSQIKGSYIQGDVLSIDRGKEEMHLGEGQTQIPSTIHLQVFRGEPHLSDHPGLLATPNAESNLVVLQDPLELGTS